MEDKREFSAEKAGIHWIATPTPFHTSDYGKYFYVDPDTGVLLKENLYPRGMKTPWHVHTYAHGIFVLEGNVKTNKGVYGPGTMIWWPAGAVAEHGATEEQDARFFFMTTGTFDLNFLGKPDPEKDAQGLVEYVQDSNSMEWSEVRDPDGNVYYEKVLFVEEQSGYTVSLRKYPAGYETGWYRSSASYGYYMLHGIMKSNEGFYGASSFLWYPQGTISRQGASKYTDAEMIYVSDKKADYIAAYDPSNWERA